MKQPEASFHKQSKQNEVTTPPTLIAEGDSDVTSCSAQKTLTSPERPDRPLTTEATKYLTVPHVNITSLNTLTSFIVWLYSQFPDLSDIRLYLLLVLI